MEKTKNRFMVGDIVIINNPRSPLHLCTAFIEEVVRQPTDRQDGVYSLYGLYGVKESNEKKFYYGDFSGFELIRDGEMSVKDLLDYRRDKPDGIKRDIGKVIRAVIRAVPEEWHLRRAAELAYANEKDFPEKRD